MKPAYILHLLVEASTADVERANKIQCELDHASSAMGKDGVFEYDTPAAGILCLMDALFVKLYNKTPHLLPDMLPFFILVCGDKEDEELYAS